jgi:hypothetical protein
MHVACQSTDALDLERGNISDFAVDGVLRRHNPDLDFSDWGCDASPADSP